MMSCRRFKKSLFGPSSRLPGVLPPDQVDVPGIQSLLPAEPLMLIALVPGPAPGAGAAWFTGLVRPEPGKSSVTITKPRRSYLIVPGDHTARLTGLMRLFPGLGFLTKPREVYQKLAVNIYAVNF